MASNDPPQQGGRGTFGRKGNRLPSLKGPRDLTLGGVQKKTFTPNIPVRPRDRSKDNRAEATEAESGDARSGEKRRKHEGRGGGRGRGDRGRGGRGGRGRGRGDREFIQSHSIFEQGPTEGMRKPTSTSWMGEAGERSGSSRGSGSGIKREKQDTEETKRILDDILKDDFIVDKRRSEDPNMMPIKLPINKDKVKAEVKAEDKPDIKKEPEAESISSESPDVEMKDETKRESPIPGDEHFLPASAAELFRGAAKSDRGELIFIQLPDALPGEPSGRNEDPRAAKQAAQGQTTNPVDLNQSLDAETELAKRLGLCNIQDFSEGYVGKIQVHRSGRTRLVLGSVALDVDLGARPGFLQELVSVRLDDTKREGDMAVLGHVNHKLVCVPDFETMLAT